MKYTTRPLSDRTWLRPAAERRRSQFKITWWGAQQLLQRELDMIDGCDLVVEIDIREQDLRLDGMLRANAKPIGAPAVVVAFESKHGPLLYRSDTYGEGSWASPMEVWQHNVYAVALTLEALRAVDRYGATRLGEQYRGYRQIEAASPTSSLSRLDAAEVIALAAYPTHDLEQFRAPAVRALMDGDEAIRTSIVRAAQRRSHPDTGGSAAAFQSVRDALAMLGGER